MTTNSSFPHFFSNLEIVGSATNEIPKYRETHLLLLANKVPNQKENVDVKAEGSPLIFFTAESAKAYKNNDFDAIKMLQTKANDDLRVVYENVSRNKSDAWTKVRSPDSKKDFYMTWSDSACLWSYTEGVTK